MYKSHAMRAKSLAWCGIASFTCCRLACMRVAVAEESERVCFTSSQGGADKTACDASISTTCPRDNDPRATSICSPALHIAHRLVPRCTHRPQMFTDAPMNESARLMACASFVIKCQACLCCSEPADREWNFKLHTYIIFLI